MEDFRKTVVGITEPYPTRICKLSLRYGLSSALAENFPGGTVGNGVGENHPGQALIFGQAPGGILDQVFREGLWVQVRGDSVPRMGNQI